MLVGDDLRTAHVAILLLHVLQLVLHHLLAQLGVVENLLQVLDALHQFLILGVQLLHAETRELRQAHVDDGLRLDVVKVETLLQVGLSLCRCLAGSDDVHHLVDVVARDDETFEDVCALMGLLKVKLCAADGYLMTVVYEVAYALLEVQELRA